MELNNGWNDFFNQEKDKEYFDRLELFLKKEYKESNIFPNQSQIFRAYNELRPEKIKVVIIGQDPYPTKGHANGLAFSLNSFVSPLSKSLRNIYKELIDDVGVTRINGDLSEWSKQGVFLINTVLTVREGEANSHKGKGWEQFTDETLEYLNNNFDGIIYVLWGAKAQSKKDKINSKRNKILEAPHPSPLSAYRGFFGSKPFSKINDFLKEKMEAEIEW